MQLSEPLIVKPAAILKLVRNSNVRSNSMPTTCARIINWVWSTQNSEKKSQPKKCLTALMNYENVNTIRNE